MFGYILVSSCSNLCWKLSSPKTPPFINQPYSCGDSPQTSLEIYNLPIIKSSIGRQELSEYNTTLFPSALTISSVYVLPWAGFGVRAQKSH